MKLFAVSLLVGIALGAPQGSQKDLETVPYTVVPGKFYEKILPLDIEELNFFEEQSDFPVYISVCSVFLLMFT